MALLRGVTSFEPSTHGFRFANTFAIHFADLGIPRAGTIGQGLCGGMSLHAKRLFECGEAPPALSSLPRKDTALYIAIWRRQLESLFPITWARFITWQARGNRPGRSLASIGEMTKREWPKLRARLDAGEPTVLGLIRLESKNPARAGANHQVLAIGYSLDSGADQARIDLYDPNHPGRVSVLTVDLGEPGHQIRITQATGEVVRGFFLTAAQ